MKKVKISYTPPVVYIIFAIIFVVAILDISAFLNEICLFIGVIAGIVALLFIDKQGTVVEFGDGKIIRCKSFIYPHSVR